MPIQRLVFCSLVILQLTGCAAALQARENKKIDTMLAKGQYEKLGKYIEEDMEAGQGDALEYLHAAEAWRLKGDHDRSNLYYDATETAYANSQDAGLMSQAGSQLTRSVGLSALTPYVPGPSEMVLVNYYKALNHVSEGNDSAARVEFNRVRERTRRALQAYAGEVQEAKENALSGNQGNEGLLSFLNGIDTDSMTSNMMHQHYPETRKWEVYGDFMLPPAVYMVGLYKGLSSRLRDISGARYQLNRVVGMTGSKVVANDYAELKKGRICPENNCVWVIAESGFGPELEERRIDFPVPINGRLVIASMAVPAIKSRSDQIGDMPATLLARGKPVALERLARMDQVVQTEYKERLPGIIARSVIQAAIKVYLQYETAKRDELLGLVASAASAVSTSADIRIWRAMPGSFWVGRITRPADRRLSMAYGVGKTLQIDLPSTGSSVIYIKQFAYGSDPLVEVMQIK